MKYLNNILLASLAILLFSSCLKKRATTLDGDGPKNVVEFLNTFDNVASFANSFYPEFFVDLKVMAPGESKEININVSYSGKEVAPSDISVEVEIDPSVLDRYNEENGTDYELPPASVFSFPTSFVIKKGERVSTQKLTVTLSTDFSFDIDYAVPLRIKSVSPSHTISANFGAALYTFGVRNEFDGIYDVTGTLVDANGLYEGVQPYQGALVSSGASMNLYYNWEYAYPNILVSNLSTGGLANTGIRPKFSFSGNTVTVLDANNAQIGSGTYDSGSRTMDISWVVGRWSVNETWVYSEERP